jgi:hypothetical protein
MLLRFAVPPVMAARDRPIQTAAPKVRPVTIVVRPNGHFFETVENFWVPVKGAVQE